METKWKAIATIGIWIGAGIACIFAPEAAATVAPAAAGATILMWIWGKGE